MGFTGKLVEDLILVVIALLWVRWSTLDLGLRPPSMKGVWVWVLLFIVWVTLESVALLPDPVATNADWLQELDQLSVTEYVVLVVVTGPIAEELLFRGALFSALMRRWGLITAVIVPSILWASMHLHYELWTVASIAVSGVLLAMIRWKSGSLYVPVILHAGANLLDMLITYLPRASN